MTNKYNKNHSFIRRIYSFTNYKIYIILKDLININFMDSGYFKSNKH